MLLIVGGAALLLYIMTRARVDVNNLAFRLVGVRLGSASISGLTLKVQIGVLNTRNQPLSADRVALKIKLNDAVIGEGISHQPIRIHAARSSSFELPVTIYPLKIMTFVKAVREMVKGGAGKLEIEGFVHVGGSQYRLSEALKVDKSLIPFVNR